MAKTLNDLKTVILELFSADMRVILDPRSSEKTFYLTYETSIEAREMASLSDVHIIERVILELEDKILKSKLVQLKLESLDDKIKEVTKELKDANLEIDRLKMYEHYFLVQSELNKSGK